MPSPLSQDLSADNVLTHCIDEAARWGATEGTTYNTYYKYVFVIGKANRNSSPEQSARSFTERWSTLTSSRYPVDKTASLPCPICLMKGNAFGCALQRAGILNAGQSFSPEDFPFTPQNTSELCGWVRAAQPKQQSHQYGHRFLHRQWVLLTVS